jgi:hypothetical protein
VFAPAAAWHTLRPSERYLARVHAYAATHPDAIFMLEAAAVLYGLPVAGRLDDVHVLSPGTAAGRRVAGVRFHVTGEERRMRRADGILVVAPEELAVDIARARHPAIALMTADAVLRSIGGGAHDLLLARNEDRASSRGRAAARWALERATPLAESALESISRAVIEWLGYPHPDLQVAFHPSDGLHYRADMFWPEERVIGEADGRVKYDGTHGDGATAVWEEKRREDELRRHVAGFARWGHADVRLVDPFDAILRTAGLRPLRPRSEHPLLTLRAALERRESTAAPRIHGGLDSRRASGFSRVSRGAWRRSASRRARRPRASPRSPRPP